MSWRRLSMAAIQRILCQQGRTVAPFPCRDAARSARPSFRRRAHRATTRAAQQPRLPGTSRTPRDVKRYAWHIGTRPAVANGSIHRARTAGGAWYARSPVRSRPGLGSVANVRNEAARHRVHDAQPPLGAARRVALRCGRGTDRGAGLADDSATGLSQACPDDVVGTTARFAPAGEEKNGRRPHRCLQSGREIALRRPQNLEQDLRSSRLVRRQSKSRRRR
jgi:hypothetical protein